MSDVSPPLSVRVERSSSTITVQVDGEIDTATSPELERLVRQACNDDDRAIVELDLSGVGFIDSSGLRALVVTQQAITEAGGSLRVVRPSSQVVRLLELTGLGETLLGI